MIKGKTALLVAQRLAVVKLADKVSVFADRQAIEYGTHAKLYARAGKYKELYDKQAQFYREIPNQDFD